MNKDELKNVRSRLGRGELPEGSGLLTTRELFYERLYYKQEIFPQSNIPSQNFWYLKPLYGLINRKAQIVYPTESALKQFKAVDTLLAINFVVDAFEDLQKFIIQASMLGQIDSVASPYVKIEPVNAWVSLHQSFHTLMEVHYDQFYTQWSRRKSRNLKINSFQQFMEQFNEYLLKVVTEIPFTRSSFIISTLSNPFISGLVIDIKDFDDNNDKPKKERFINDPNFEFFQTSANKFGFMIDENAPWRLIADVGSSAMKRYMQTYGITFDTLFDSYYYRAELTDLDVFKSYLTSFYESYVESEPEIRYLARSRKSKKLEQVVKQRKITSTSSITNLNNSFWLKYYIKIRLFELIKTINNINIEKLISTVININNKLGTVKALEYFSDQINGFNLIAFPEYRKKRFN